MPTTIKSLRPEFQDIGIAITDLIATDNDWGAIIFADDQGLPVKFTVFHRFIFDAKLTSDRYDGVDVWDITDILNWRVRYPDDWSPRRAAIRQRAEQQLADVLDALVLRLLPSFSDSATDLVRRTLSAGAKPGRPSPTGTR